MDVLLVSGLDFSTADAGFPQIGQEILLSILQKEFLTKLINFDHLNQTGEFCYGSDIRETIRRMADYLLSFHARAIGFYTICNSFLTVVEIAGEISRKSPETAIFLGGPHATVTAQSCLRRLPFIRAVCRGESEKSILPFVRALLAGTDLSCVPGVSFLRDGRYIETPAPALLEEEALGDYAVLDHGPDYAFDRGEITLEGGRGCPYGCSFCSTSLFWGRHFRIKPVDTLLAEMDALHARYGARSFSIQHDIFTARRAHLRAFCDALIARGAPYVWRCSSRADVLDSACIERMARSGLHQIYLGIETGSPRMQNIIHKHLRLESVYERVRELVQAGVYITSSFIYGFPEETYEDFRQTLEMMERLYLIGNRSIQLHRFFPLPATEEARKVEAEAYFDENDVDLSIYNRKTISPEGLALIRENKPLFLQFYTFRSEIRAKYPFIEAVPLLLSSVSEGCYETGKYLIRAYGMEKLYFRAESLFERIYRNFDEVLLHPEPRKGFMDYLAQLICALNDPVAEALHRYETDLIAFALQEDRRPVTRRYRLDVLKAQRQGLYEQRETEVFFFFDQRRQAVRAIKLSANMS